MEMHWTDHTPCSFEQYRVTYHHLWNPAAHAVASVLAVVTRKISHLCECFISPRSIFDHKM